MTETQSPSQSSAGDIPTKWFAAPPRYSKTDAVAIGLWTLAILLYFGDLISFQKALFYFDITEINLPYRDFFSRELKAGRFSRWIPGLYCGHPLYSESQAGYLHPLKYLFYPWMETWKAFSLDVIVSIWLTGVGAYVWLRRHVGPWAALTGASIAGFSGFTWAHFVHTSMINALTSVPWLLWCLEDIWCTKNRRGYVIGGLALACQVFAGHLQDAILTGGLLFTYALAVALGTREWKNRLAVLTPVLGIGLLGVLFSAVQWIPSKELIDRSPRAGGLTWDEMTYGSWHPELLPTLLIREAYGTRARDTDWIDGFYPYHEMNIYMGVVGLFLAMLGAAANRDRWVASWLIVTAVGILLILGRFTFLMDLLPKVPLIGSGRIPVRYHLWVAMATSALAAVGVDRLGRIRLGLGPVSVRTAWICLGTLGLISIPILLYAYSPVWNEPYRWNTRYHQLRYQWLAWEWIEAVGRTFFLLAILSMVLHALTKPGPIGKQPWVLAGLPLLCLGDLLLTHRFDVARIDPQYWSQPPASARWLAEQSDVVRIFGEHSKSSGEPGYASEQIDFMSIRETLSWSLAPVWNLSSITGETPIISKRRLAFTDTAPTPWRHVLEGLTHVISSLPGSERRLGPGVKLGSVTVHPNPEALPRLRILGKPLFASNVEEAKRLLIERASELPQKLVLESLTPLEDVPEEARGSASLIQDLPERVVAKVDAETPLFLVLADTFDPGWKATVDGQAAEIRPAYIAFRSVYVPPGQHTVEFTYEPKGFRSGLLVSVLGLVLLLFVSYRRPFEGVTIPTSGDLGWSSYWPRWVVLGMILVIGLSIPAVKDGHLSVQQRWNQSLHRFTWGAGLEAIEQAPSAGPRRKLQL